MQRLPLSRLTAILPVLLLVVFIYYPGLSGGFVLDDYSNILHQPDLAMQEWSWAELKRAALSLNTRPIPRATFGIQHLMQGKFDPFWLKFINLVIHLLNTVLLFTISLLLLQQLKKPDASYASDRIYLVTAAAISLAWALHPVNLTSVLYIVQRMNSLSTLFVLAGVLVYITGRKNLTDAPIASWTKILSSIIIFLPLAWFSKENGGLLPLFLFIIELTFFRFKTESRRDRTGLFLFYTLFLLIPAILAGIYILQHPGRFHHGFINRDFDVRERLLTEARVMWMYIRMILIPTPAQFSLFHDDITLSKTLFEPISTLFSVGGLAILLGAALFSIKKLPALAFGLLFFLAGHLIESTFMPLELVYEHRNYLPSFGLIFALFYYLAHLGEKKEKMVIAYASMVTMILLFAMNTHLRVMDWSTNVRFYLTEVQFHPNSPRANYEAGKVYGQLIEMGEGDLESHYKQAVYFFTRSTQLRNNSISGLFGNYLAAIDTDHKVDQAWIDEIKFRLANRPIQAVSTIWLSNMINCIKENKCSADTLQLKDMINAALENQNASNTRKARLYSISADYSYIIDKDLKQAISMAKNAIDYNPGEAKHRLMLINYLVLSEQLVEAGKMLESLKEKDIHGRFYKEIGTLSHLINNSNQGKIHQ